MASTDQRRFQVFVSSTYQDLRKERQAVTAALLECDAFPAGMELFPATDDDAWTLIKRVIDESDYYLLVIGGKYGSVDPSDGISYTEKEFDYAAATKKPVMAFLHGDPTQMAVAASESTDAKRKALEDFKGKVKSSKHVKFWTSAEQLAGQVALTFNRFVRLYPATGWIRADQATSSETLKDLNDARDRIAFLEDSLNSARTNAPDGTSNLAQGDDEFRVPVWAASTFPNSSGYQTPIRAWVTCETSWDELFGGVAPRLLQECEETELHKAINEHLRVNFGHEVIDELHEKAKLTRKSTQRDQLAGPSVSVDDEDFGTILIQFMALGYIRRSDKKRSVSDTGTYWALTPYGETRAIQLRALRRNPGPSDNEP